MTHIVADQGLSEQQSQPVEVRWLQPTTELRYVELLLEDRLLSIGFEQCSHNLAVNDKFVAEKLKQKLEKVMK